MRRRNENREESGRYAKCPLTLERRFLSFVDGRDYEGCWPWTGAVYPSGYAAFAPYRGSPRAARTAYELFVGPIPAGLQIDHLCRRKDCVNPAHLEPVTAKENSRRAKAVNKNKCLRGHELKPNPWHQGWNYCPVCQAVRCAEYEKRQKTGGTNG